MLILRYSHNKPSPDFAGLSDEEIISQYKDTSDNNLVGELYNRYVHLVFGLCCKYLKREEERHDAAMQVFEKLFEVLKQHEIGNFKSWLYSVAKNHCLMLIKKNKGMYYVDNEVAQRFRGDFVEFADDVTLKAALNDKEPTELLTKAIQDLNEDQRICIELFYLQDKAYKEITEMTEYSLLQVKSFIQNGKRNLKIMLSKHNEIEW